MQNRHYAAPYMLPEQSFLLTIVAALIVHMMAFVAWHLSPKTEVKDIPIRIMNVRFGEDEEGDELTQQSASLPSGMNAPEVDALVDSITRSMPLQKPKTDKADDSAKQYVREVNYPQSKKSTRVKATGAKGAEMMSRYTQLISIWIYKFQTYPENERQQGIKGDSVVRIRVDRRGNVRYYALERTTGNDALDRAAIDMVRRANPVPAVPDDYPEGDLLEFLIPVKFK